MSTLPSWIAPGQRVTIIQPLPYGFHETIKARVFSVGRWWITVERIGSGRRERFRTFPTWTGDYVSRAGSVLESPRYIRGSGLRSRRVSDLYGTPESRFGSSHYA